MRRVASVVDPFAARPIAVQVERLAQRPAVLERVEAARRVQRARRVRCRRWNRGPQRGPRARSASPDQARAARPEQPLVAARDEEVAAQIRDGGLRRRAVHTVHTRSSEAPVRCALTSSACRRRLIGSFTPVLEWTHVTATTRVRSVIAPLRAPDHLVLRRGPRLLIERDLRTAAPRRLLRSASCVGVEVVRCRHDLLAGRRPGRLEQPEAHRRTVGERDVARAGAEIAGRGRTAASSCRSLLMQVVAGSSSRPRRCASMACCTGAGAAQEAAEVQVAGSRPAAGFAAGGVFFPRTPPSASAALPANSCLRVTLIGRP